MVPVNNSPLHITIRLSQVLLIFFRLLGLPWLCRWLCHFATSLKLAPLFHSRNTGQININWKGQLGASLQHDVLKTDTNLHKQLKLVTHEKNNTNLHEPLELDTHQQPWCGVHLLKVMCNFSAKSPMWIFLIKNQLGHLLAGKV